MRKRIEYNTGSRHLHHSMAILVIGLLLCGWSMITILSPSLKSTFYPYHKIFGLLSLGLVIFRLIWRYKKNTPPLPLSMPAWQRGLAIGVQVTLYICLIVMPLSGWIMATASNHAPTLGTWHLAMPGIPMDKTWSQWAGNAHYFSAWGLTLAIGLHIAGALKHWLDGDDIIRRMFPKK